VCACTHLLPQLLVLASHLAIFSVQMIEVGRRLIITSSQALGIYYVTPHTCNKLFSLCRLFALQISAPSSIRFEVTT
jgi:hypothetical protein